MRFLITESEALLIKQKFNFVTLLGLNVNKRIRFGTERLLRKKGIIYSNNGKEELKVEYRALFSNWEKMRYSIVRPELNDRNHLQCVLSNNKMSMFFVRKKETITIDVFDFSEKKFDEIIAAFSEMRNVTASDSMFNISLSLDDYEQFINCKDKSDFEKWEKATGINVTVLEKYVLNINTKDKAQMLLVEDHFANCGYMSKIVNAVDGIYAVKHITYGDNQKMVLLYGSTQFVIDSIYNF